MSGLTLAQEYVADKSNEWSGATWTGANATCLEAGAPGGAHQITAIPHLIEVLALVGQIITLDAMGTHTQIATAILSFP